MIITSYELKSLHDSTLYLRTTDSSNFVKFYEDYMESVSQISWLNKRC